MKNNRNAPCPCGSGKKYKKCCLLKSNDTSKKTIEKLSLKERNKILLNAISDIFNLKGKVKWSEFKKNISGEQIKELYSVIAAISI